MAQTQRGRFGATYDPRMAWNGVATDFDGIAVFGVVLSVAFVWICYFRWKDRHPEPWSRVFAAAL